jgi:hypothetical protein
MLSRGVAMRHCVSYSPQQIKNANLVLFGPAPDAAVNLCEVLLSPGRGEGMFSISVTV